MNGKLVAGGIVVLATVFGIGLYYSTVYAHYEPLDASLESSRITVTTFEGLEEDLLAEALTGIDGSSSPIKYRACFETPLSLAMMTETFVPYDKPAPLIAPNWFECFDAKAIGADLEAGKAVAFMGAENFTYGIDRVIAVYPDGRGYAWNQINSCGEAVFDGDPAPVGCPPAPEGN
ncbi:DUF6446 family protein [Celeribacter litoreus]|uniref:DUF6446 family protein n=1 Tax=Celeribacter litoreus TaxID=2876714 RepID=UPI001CCBCFAB|nr:DUF6446 family protein [Celeribacter litoreus]MCA0045212.1 DUF6446 family protein [Celeribacter litoreus]